MSRPRSRSPNYRRFPWEEPGFDPHKVVADLTGNPRSHHSREDSEERWFSEEMYPGGPRRSPPFPEDRGFMRQRSQEFYQRRPSPRRDEMSFDSRRLSPPRDGAAEEEERRRGFRELFQSFENRGRLPPSPQRPTRERLATAAWSHAEQQREAGTGWRREELLRGQGKFRDLSPRSDEHRGGGGRERGRRSTQDPHRDRRREESHQERNPHFKRQRREMDDASDLGFRKEEHFGEQRFSADKPRDGFRGGAQGGLPRGDKRPLIVEHDHGIKDGRGAPRWEQFGRGDPGPDFDRQRSPGARPSSQERFSRLDDREDARGRRFQDNWRDSSYPESRRSPTPQERPNAMRYGDPEGAVSHRGREEPRQFNRSQGGRTGATRTQPRPQQGFQEEQRAGYRPPREDRFPEREREREAEPDWSEETRPPPWKRDRPGSVERHPQSDPDPKGPRQRTQGWSAPKSSNMSVVTEETLTIKVDMSRPVSLNSSLCYSSDRQLSLDLVNVGRQRLDFLPMLEHSGTYRETATHTGTFAQEIITLVHHVKEQYFRDDGVTLNQRFSAPHKGFAEAEPGEELTLDERFSSKRGFSLNMNSLLDEDDDDDEEEALFSRPGTMQPVRGPGDLRHDLERRRQERLEGVKVTISGSSTAQRPPRPRSEAVLDEMAPLEDEGFSSWSEEQHRKHEGSLGPRRGAYRPSSGPQRRNNRFGNRLGPMRRQNNRSNPTGPNW